MSFTKDDIDWESVGKLENNHDAYLLQACYYFGIGEYKDGKLRYGEEGYPDYKVFNILDYDITYVK